MLDAYLAVVYFEIKYNWSTARNDASDCPAAHCCLDRPAMLHEMAMGIEASGMDFVWVIRNKREEDNGSEKWMLGTPISWPTFRLQMRRGSHRHD
nr:scopoletin glucosyltransferase-like [Ipomoea batatas]